jgi:hypothetical protein
MLGWDAVRTIMKDRSEGSPVKAASAGEVQQVLVMFPSREELLLCYFSSLGCFERKHDLTQGLEVVHQVD